MQSKAPQPHLEHLGSRWGPWQLCNDGRYSFQLFVGVFDLRLVWCLLLLPSGVHAVANMNSLRAIDGDPSYHSHESFSFSPCKKNPWWGSFDFHIILPSPLGRESSQNKKGVPACSLSPRTEVDLVFWQNVALCVLAPWDLIPFMYLLCFLTKDALLWQWSIRRSQFRAVTYPF